MKRQQIKLIAATALISTITLAGTLSPATAASELLVASKISTSTITSAQEKSVLKAISFKIDGRMKSKINSMQWTMVAGKLGNAILSGNQYRLVNSVTGSGIKRQKRTIAANLGWLPQNSKEFNVRVKRKSGDGQVLYGDIVALELKSYGWLRYKKQSKGINISDDNNNPHYIWIVTGGVKGTKLVSGMPFALYNTKYNTEITYCARTWGIDLGWNGKSKCGGRLAKLSGRVFGKNGLFARDGLSGKAYGKLRDHVCEAGVGAAAAGVLVATSGSGSAIVAAATPLAVKECKKI
jgi:hypothetical protein